jgi:hypothetical protein
LSLTLWSFKNRRNTANSMSRQEDKQAAIGSAFDLSAISSTLKSSVWVCFARSISNPEILRLSMAAERPLTSDAVRVRSSRDEMRWLIPGVEVALHSLDLRGYATGETFGIVAEGGDSPVGVDVMATEDDDVRQWISELALSIETWFREPAQPVLPSIEECRLDMVDQGTPVAQFSWVPDLRRTYKLSRAAGQWELTQLYDDLHAVPRDVLVPLRTADAVISFSPSLEGTGTANIIEPANLLAPLGLHFSASADEFRAQSASTSAGLVEQPMRPVSAPQDTEWLDRAAVQQTGVNRFVAKAAHDSSLTLEAAFQFPGVGQSVILTQMRNGVRHRAPLTVQGHHIEFDGGMAFPSADVAASVAAAMRLPDAYVHWAEVGAEFARTQRRTTSRTRGALQGLLRSVSDAALSHEQLFRFLFEPYGAMRASAARGPSAGTTGPTPVVTRIESAGPVDGRIHLWWPGPAPTIDRVDVFVRGKPIDPAATVTWDAVIQTVNVVGTTLDIDVPAQAQVSGNALRIDFG